MSVWLLTVMSDSNPRTKGKAVLLPGKTTQIQMATQRQPKCSESTSHLQGPCCSTIAPPTPAGCPDLSDLEQTRKQLLSCGRGVPALNSVGLAWVNQRSLSRW